MLCHGDNLFWFFFYFTFFFSFDFFTFLLLMFDYLFFSFLERCLDTSAGWDGPLISQKPKPPLFFSFFLEEPWRDVQISEKNNQRSRHFFLPKKGWHHHLSTWQDHCLTLQKTSPFFFSFFLFLFVDALKFDQSSPAGQVIDHFFSLELFAEVNTWFSFDCPTPDLLAWSQVLITSKTAI